MEPFQERLPPMWALCGCALVNRASWRVARGVLEEVRARWPDAATLARAPLDELEAATRRLGFARSRAQALAAIGAAFRDGPPLTRADVLRIRGCGCYAADSWAVFVEGDLAATPADRVLRAYLEERRACA